MTSPVSDPELTAAEKKAIMKKMGDFIKDMKTPGKVACVNLIKEMELECSWQKIKWYVYYQIQKKKNTW